MATKKEDMAVDDNPSMEKITRKKSEIIKVSEKYGVTNIRVFGSVIRNQALPTSDIDFLIHVEQNSGLSLFDLAKLQEELEQLIGHSVDLVLDDTLHPMISQRIQEEAVSL